MSIEESGEPDRHNGNDHAPSLAIHTDSIETIENLPIAEFSR